MQAAFFTIQPKCRSPPFLQQFFTFKNWLEEKKMQSWQKNRTYRRYENTDGSYTNTITVDGEKLAVSKDVYEAYAQSERQLEYMERDLKRNRVLQDAYGKAVQDENGLPIILPEREVSLDMLLDYDWDFPSSAPLPEEVVLKQFEISALHRCFELLNIDDQALITSLYYEGLTEREYAETSGIPQKTINDRKRRALKKLYQLLKK